MFVQSCADFAVQSIWWAGLVTRHVMLVLLTKHLTLLPEQITVIFWAHLKWYQCISASRQEMWWRIGVDLKIWEIEGLGRDIGINPRNNNTTTQRREKAVGGEGYLIENPLTLNDKKHCFVCIWPKLGLELEQMYTDLWTLKWQNWQKISHGLSGERGLRV